MSAPASNPTIVVAAVALVRDGAVLTVRKQGTARFMLVGGKLEPGESARDAAIRETLEEVGLRLREVQLLGEYESAAANEPDHRLVSTVFLAEADGEPTAAAEIAEVRWTPLDPAGLDDLAPMLEHNVLPELRRLASAPPAQQP
ncbi:NUDIX domain-containing protein [Nocardioides sp. zg-536]|uniref:NUDIX domain-containing protein n=1 Tax=Nocardioides faecalis TaxID=2803858 RepID=A0A938YC76_9ACTN|nr:NUDIX domain-containing protein [Nocardioides faecalis]MBM9461670.1 NUDIX domain-containing protein [Nocardioides faecalis]QVI59937.1 NUDIX domain-containing protein [Nocardioides faecalis]